MYNAERLVMTEEACFSGAAQNDAFNEFEPGVTALPFHPWCRSTTVPYFDEDFRQIGERATSLILRLLMMA